jgi:hypothetical protein
MILNYDLLTNNYPSNTYETVGCSSLNQRWNIYYLEVV